MIAICYTVRQLMSFQEGMFMNEICIGMSSQVPTQVGLVKLIMTGTNDSMKVYERNAPRLRISIVVNCCLFTSNISIQVNSLFKKQTLPFFCQMKYNEQPRI